MLLYFSIFFYLPGPLSVGSDASADNPGLPLPDEPPAADAGVVSRGAQGVEVLLPVVTSVRRRSDAVVAQGTEKPVAVEDGKR